MMTFFNVQIDSYLLLTMCLANTADQDRPVSMFTSPKRRVMKCNMQVVHSSMNSQKSMKTQKESAEGEEEMEGGK